MILFYKVRLEIAFVYWLFKTSDSIKQQILSVFIICIIQISYIEWKKLLNWFFLFIIKI